MRRSTAAIVKPVLAESACGLGGGRSWQRAGKQPSRVPHWIAHETIDPAAPAAPLPRRWQGAPGATHFEGLGVALWRAAASQARRGPAGLACADPGPPHPSRRHRKRRRPLTSTSSRRPGLRPPESSSPQRQGHRRANSCQPRCRNRPGALLPLARKVRRDSRLFAGVSAPMEMV